MPLALEVLKTAALVGCYHSYGRTHFFNVHPEDGSRKFLRNIGTQLRENTEKCQDVCCNLKKEAVYSSEKLLTSTRLDGIVTHMIKISIFSTYYNR
jgi:hypothetical protein